VRPGYVPSARALPRSGGVAFPLYLLQFSFFFVAFAPRHSLEPSRGHTPRPPPRRVGHTRTPFLWHNCIGRLSPVLVPSWLNGFDGLGGAPPPPSCPLLGADPPARPRAHKRGGVCASPKGGSPHRAPYRARLGALPRSERTKNVKSARSKKERGYIPPEPSALAR